MSFVSPDPERDRRPEEDHGRPPRGDEEPRDAGAGDGDKRPRIGGTGIALVSFLYLFALPSFAAAELAFAPPKVLALGCFITAVVLTWVMWVEPAHWHWGQRAKAVGTSVSIALVATAFWFVVHEITVSAGNGALVEPDVPLPMRPTHVVFGDDGVVWVASRTGWVRGYDSTQRQQVGTALRIGISLRDVVAFRGYLFATVDHGSLIRFYPGPTQKPTREKRFGKESGAIAVGGGSIWVTDPSDEWVYRFDFGLRQIAKIPLEGWPGTRATAIAVGGDLVWVVGGNAIYRIDPASNTVVRSRTVLKGPSDLVIAGDVLYVAHPTLGTIEKRDAFSGALIPGPIDVGRGPVAMTATAGRLFVCSSATDRLLTLSPKTGKSVESPLAVGDEPADLDFVTDRHELWVANLAGESITPILTGP